MSLEECGAVIRSIVTRSLVESFGYDALNRLSTFGDKVVKYDNCGNIRQKGDAGELVYTNPNRPYAVTGLAPLSEDRINYGIEITYTAAERPSVIARGTQKAVLTYNANHDRIRMQYSDNSRNLLTRYYLGGNYELDVDSTGMHERLYLGGGYYDASAVLMKKGDTSSVYFIHRDYLGSVLQIADAQGNIVEENNFDAWGCRRNPSTQKAYTIGTAPKLLLGRGYTGHEHLEMFGVINMNARLYDPVLGRFLTPDPYVQMLDFTQAFNRYSYCMNSPLCYVDENGEFFFSIFLGPVGAILDGICWGAVIGAGASAVTYSVSTLISGQPWNSGNFWKSVGVGAVGGAIGGGFGAVGSLSALGTFGNSVGYNMLSGVANTAATNAIFGNDMNWSDIYSVIGGSAIGIVIPTFKGVNGGKLANSLAEIGYNSMRGTATGLTSGVVNAIAYKDPDRIWQDAVGGAISGVSRSIAMDVIFGAPYKVEKSYGAEGLYRGGGLSTLLMKGGGITLGRNMYVNSRNDEEGTRFHENYHIQQQNQMGWANFYGRTIQEYSQYGFFDPMDNVYTTKGTLEYKADEYRNRMMKIPWRSSYYK